MEVRAVNSSELSSIIDVKNKKISLVFLFTSWCKACSGCFSQVAQLHEKYLKNNDISVHLISLDQKEADIKRFADTFKQYEGKIIFFKNANGKLLPEAFLENKIEYSGSIPHLTLFENGKMLISGNYKLDSIAKYIEQFE